jgi:G6PDH family F420-dependent oxidoreductase
VTDLGFSLISEEHGVNALVDGAVAAERAGFEFSIVSDHFHPWLPAQGESPFVWTTLGAIAREVEDLRIGTGVTCPLFRIDPLNVAHAAATVASAYDGEFFLGLGTGEALNEHVRGDRFPSHDRRLHRLREAIEVVRGLWTGDPYDHHGEHFTVEDARLFTTPDETPPIHVAADGTAAAEFASQFGDGLVSTGPHEEVIEAFDTGDGRPRHAQVTACWNESEQEARRIAHEQWRNTAAPGELKQLLPSPVHFQQATQSVDEETVASSMPTGPDADEHVEAIQEYVDAGYDKITVHQVGDDLAGAADFYEREVMPSFA